LTVGFLVENVVDQWGMDFPSELKIYQLPGAFVRQESKDTRRRAAQVRAIAVKITERAKKIAEQSKMLLDRKLRECS